MTNQISNQDKFYSHLYDFFSRYFGDYHLPFIKNSLVDNDEYGKIYNKSDVKLYFKTESLIYVGLSKFETDNKISELKKSSIHEIRKNLFEKIKPELEKEIKKYCNVDVENLFKKIEPKEEKTKHFFIHKNPKSFIEGRLKSYLTEYFWGTEGTNFSKKNIEDMEKVQKFIIEIAEKINDVENEIKKIWYKPKISFTCNYVICLSELNEEIRKEIFENIFKNKNENHSQLEEWKKLFEKRIENFEKENLEKYENLPIDTKNFDENLKYKILSSIENIEEKTNGVLINGDNWQGLNSIKEKYKGTVKSIYIDPPYNTGNDGFAYLDNYSSSTWLTMMRDRLELAREFLSDDGVIFVSIDDNEQARLKLLMDEIFGEGNFVGSVIYDKCNSSSDSDNLQKNHEYIVCYAKLLSNLSLYETTIKDYRIYKDDNGDIYTLGTLVTGGEGGTLNSRPNLGYSIYFNSNTNNFIAVCDYDKELAKTSNTESKVYKNDKVLINSGFNIIIRPPKKDNGSKLGRWTWSIETFNENKKNIKISQSTTGYTIQKKQYLHSDNEYNKDQKNISIEKENTPKSITIFKSKSGTTHLKEIFNEKKFDFPKPEKLIQHFFNLSESSLILDFFLGSGTTTSVAHKMNRQYIGIEIDENTFENVAIPRMKHVLFGEEGGISKDIKWNGGGMFKYYKLENFVFDSLKKCDVVEKNFGEIDHHKSSYFLKYGLNFEEEIDGKKPIIKFKKLYENADIFEAISNLGYKIKKINSKNSATFFYEDDDEKKEFTIKNLDEINLLDENLSNKLKEKILKYFAWE